MPIKSIVAAALHFWGVSVMTWGYMSLEHTVMHTMIEVQKGGHFQFLTVQALAISWLTMVLSLVYDVLPSTYIRRAKRAVFLIALPLSVVVTSIYWSLIMFFPRLILPPASLEEPSVPSSSQSSDGLARIPLSLDLALHATPAFMLLIDFFLFEETYGPKAAGVGATAMASLFGLWYASWVEYCATFNGVFPYPFLTVNPFPIRVVIYAVVTAVAFLSFRAINAVHVSVWGKRYVSNGSANKVELIDKTK